MSSYNISKPMKWEDFRLLDESTKQFYLDSIIKKYRPRGRDLAEMFGCANSVVSKLLSEFPSAKAMMPKTGLREMSSEWVAFISNPAPDLIPDTTSVADTTGEQVNTPIAEPIAVIEEVTTPAPISISGSITLDATPMQLVTILQNIFGDTVHHFTVSFE